MVKNSYDADSSVSAVLFMPRWKAIPTELDDNEREALKAVLPETEEMFEFVGGKWTAKDDWTATQESAIANLHTRVLDLWIVDNGIGMSVRTIEDHWMVIGTDTKDLNDTSKGGRVVTGAKGIGRFALDRLGQQCEMYSAEAGTDEISHWLVDWSAFEGTGKVIGEVEAVLETECRQLVSLYRDYGLEDILPKNAPEREGVSRPIDYSTGTAIRIGLLNDLWDEKDSIRLKETLEALLPPHDRGDFDIFVHDHRVPLESGFIDNFPPDQFDYRMLADVTADGQVKITLQRQEIDFDRISPTFFDLPAMQKPRYSRADFKAGEITYSKPLAELIRNKEDPRQFLDIGPFFFTLYFFKLTNATADNLERFPQKNFDVAARKRWLANSGGIRLYRDNFRVRPYGEPRSSAYDWLSMGARSTANPAGASRPGWRVSPTQVAGTIHLTKRDNPSLADQSNREGIINERAFSAFRQLVIALIQEFEHDRAYVLQHFLQAYKVDNPEPADVEEGRAIAEKALEAEKSSAAGDTAKPQPELAPEPSAPEVTSRDDVLKVSRAYGSEKKKNEALRDDIQVMRGMATLGTVLVSFTHELRQVRANIETRSQRLSDAIRDVVSDEKLAAVDEMNSPFRILERLRLQDQKVSRWVNFALAAVSPVKRRRRRIDLGEYLEGMNTYWGDLLTSRSIKLETYVESGAELKVLAHEIDLDSVFYNLVNNSIEALVRPSIQTSREISIKVVPSEDGGAEIQYKDNGPGLSAEFPTREDIFLFGVTSKKEEAAGEAVGTGLGMWLLKNVVHEYGGKVRLDCEPGQAGFAISITLPTTGDNE
ncbi:sensor histidine kinase [Nisaea sp.]|uniref:sensor histidine kinase n=1 Tax=Nisaea sp. TaxID=2024842 RepID=UPI003297864B